VTACSRWHMHLPLGHTQHDKDCAVGRHSLADDCLMMTTIVFADVEPVRGFIMDNFDYLTQTHLYLDRIIWTSTSECGRNMTQEPRECWQAHSPVTVPMCLSTLSHGGWTVTAVSSSCCMFEALSSSHHCLSVATHLNEYIDTHTGGYVNE